MGRKLGSLFVLPPAATAVGAFFSLPAEKNQKATHRQGSPPLAPRTPIGDGFPLHRPSFSLWENGLGGTFLFFISSSSIFSSEKMKRSWGGVRLPGG